MTSYTPATFTTDHPAPVLAHTSSDGCTTLCHPTNLVTIHTTGTTPPRCVACHDGVKTLFTACATCHGAGTYHASAATSHYVSNACTDCHYNDVTAIHLVGSVQTTRRAPVHPHRGPSRRDP